MGQDIMKDGIPNGLTASRCSMCDARCAYVHDRDTDAEAGGVGYSDALRGGVDREQCAHLLRETKESMLQRYIDNNEGGLR